MPARRPAEAVTAPLHTLQTAVSIVTDGVLRPRSGGYVPAAAPHLITFPSGSAALRAEPALALRVEYWYRIVRQTEFAGLWDLELAGYHFGVDDRDGPEIVAFHWHPDSRSHVTTPHLHPGAGAQVQRTALAAAHLPTGLISLPDVIRLAIDLGATPRRSDWEFVLDQARAALEP